MLGRPRLAQHRHAMLDTPRMDAAMDELFALHFHGCSNEIFLAASTDIYGCLTGFGEVCGTANAVHGTMRAIRQAVQSDKAQYLWVAHNHPDNSPEPSRSDQILTQRIATLARLLAVHFVDHRLFAAVRFHSICHHAAPNAAFPACHGAMRFL